MDDDFIQCNPTKYRVGRVFCIWFISSLPWLLLYTGIPLAVGLGFYLGYPRGSNLGAVGLGVAIASALVWLWPISVLIRLVRHRKEYESTCTLRFTIEALEGQDDRGNSWKLAWKTFHKARTVWNHYILDMLGNSVSVPFDCMDDGSRSRFEALLQSKGLLRP